MNMPDISQTFRDEAAELLAELEASLLQLESDPGNLEHVAKTFRAMHTLKGSGGMAGYKEVVRFTHEVESIYDRVRNGKLSVTTELLSLTLAAKDHIHALINVCPDASAHLIQASDILLEGFRGVAGGGGDAKAGGAAAPVAKAPVEEKALTFWIRFSPPQDAMRRGTQVFGLLEELSDLGSTAFFFHEESIPDLADMEPDQVYGWWDCLLNTRKGEAGVQEVFLFLDDAVTIHQVGEGASRASDLEEMKPLLKTGVGEKVETTLGRIRSAVSGISTEKAVLRKDNAGQPAGQATADQQSSSIRVDAMRLDKLVDMVGELVIIQSRLALAATRNGDSSIKQIAEELERLTSGMRDNTLGLRMVPIGTSYNLFRRMVRDLSLSMGKDITFLTEGADTELDKRVIDRLKDPLMHILRNSLDHGLETPEERIASGKPPQGVVKLSAINASGEVHLLIEDDGRGINAEKVRARAVERGLVAADAELDRARIYRLLFEPGFSTAEKVSDISGRGVGMDVVKKGIESLRGSVEIDSTQGQGTRVTIRLPLTLAIIDGLMVRVGLESFIVPLATVEACQERSGEEDDPEVGNVPRNGHLIPCVSLRRLLGVPGQPPAFERIIIARSDNMEVGLAVDRVVGRQQTVIKSLAGVYRNQKWISGTTINGDGGISLILDVQELVRFASTRDHDREMVRDAGARRKMDS